MDGEVNNGNGDDVAITMGAIGPDPAGALAAQPQQLGFSLDLKQARVGIFKVAALMVTVSMASVMHLPVGFISGAYIFAIYACFILGVGLLVLSAVLPWVPISTVSVALKLMYVELALFYIAAALKVAMEVTA